MGTSKSIFRSHTIVAAAGLDVAGDAVPGGIGAVGVKPFPRWPLALFFLGHTLISADRFVITLVLEPIKREFMLTDTQLGLLSGIGFALFFGLGGIPIGRMVDRWNRRNILVAAVAIFSSMTAIAGSVTSFAQLFSTRLLVGAGEAGGSPAMLSMISDIYPRDRRASAVAIYYAGVPLGGLLIFLFGGWLATEYGWRTVFLAAGLPGIVLAPLIWLTLREPRRVVDTTGGDALDAASFRETISFIWSQRTLRNLLATPVLQTIATSGIFSFSVSFLVRQHGVSLTEAGLIMSIAYGVVGILGTIACGFAVDRLARRDQRWRSWLCAILCLLIVPAVMLMVFSPTLGGTIIGLAIWTFLSSGTYGPLMASLHSLVGSRMRGMVSALFYFLAYFVGVSIGPQVLGVLSDLFGTRSGGAGLGSAMLIVACFYVWAAWHYYRAARTLRADLDIAAVM
jgi:predicted MFS family arabinose efflux permease